MALFVRDNNGFTRRVSRSLPKNQWSYIFKSPNSNALYETLLKENENELGKIYTYNRLQSIYADKHVDFDHVDLFNDIELGFVETETDYNGGVKYKFIIDNIKFQFDSISNSVPYLRLHISNDKHQQTYPINEKKLYKFRHIFFGIKYSEYKEFRK